MERITSIHNPTIVQVRSLHRRKARQEERAFLIEGVRLIGEAVAVGVRLRTLVVCPDFFADPDGEMAARVAAWAAGAEHALTVSPAVMRAVADTESPQGVVAVASLPDPVLPDLDPRRALVLILDGVRDPGNVGTLVRTAAAAGCTAVVTTGETADAFAPKVVRAGMGAHFRLPVVADVDWEWLGPALVPLSAVYTTEMDVPLPYDAADWTAGAAVVIGNEDHGVSEAARQWCPHGVSIPMARGVESLNAAMSGAVVLFEAARQRRVAGRR